MPDSIPSASPVQSDVANTRAYRFWPVYAVAFVRTFSYAVYGLALPNYLIYFQHVPADFLGLIVSIINLTFIFGPLIALPVTRRIGVKNAVIFSSTFSVALVGMQMLFLDPISLIILRGLDGIAIGFFWPNLQMEVSNWQRIAPKNRADRFFQTYGLSWNTGIILGDLVGYIIVFAGEGNEFAALCFSWVAMITMIPCAAALEKPGTSLAFGGTHGIAIISASQHHTASSGKRDENADRDKNIDKIVDKDRALLLAFPALFYLVGTLIYAYMKSFYPFVYPLALNDAGIASYWVYLVTFLHQAVQMWAIFSWSRKSVKSGFNTWLVAMVATITFLGLSWAFPDVITLTIAFVSNGILSGWLYNFTSKIMLEYGAAKKSLKYATFYEFFNGIGFASSPIVAGMIMSLASWLNYPVTLLIVAMSLGILLSLGTAAMKYVKKSKE
nr:MFS transporter [Candidatus Sigynarchaeota archaeon]